MSRDTSLTFRSAVFSSETDQAFIVLIDIEYDGNHLRISSDGVDTISGGDTYTAYPFEVTLPSDVEAEISRGSIQIDNVDRAIVTAIRSVTTAPSITLEVVLASDPDTIEATFSGFKLTNVYYNDFIVSADIGIESFMHEPFPGGSFLPSTFPGVF